MDFVLTTGTAATAAMLLVAMLKFAWPTAPSAAVVLSSLVSGVGLSFLVAVGKGDAINSQTIAMTIIAGIFAGATASGVRSADTKADEGRTEAQRDERREAAREAK